MSLVVPDEILFLWFALDSVRQSCVTILLKLWKQSVAILLLYGLRYVCVAVDDQVLDNH